ncbi:probable ribonuclease ZC3H12C isoform X2 [Venturia canescens]|uniref:probable ribonuclease ZC3H12C isoform X2 n=1 Tax=Venturia canescens TaxID=32260 RepID=UPI001C9D2F81|nr:probable ribonuclease ZC3H12C isoform X2 [Venturia canescens]
MFLRLLRDRLKTRHGIKTGLFKVKCHYLETMTTSTNDSIIICESPSPSKSDPSIDRFTNYRKRLRSPQEFKSTLGTVYESPLVHLRRNNVPINKARTENGISLDTTPQRKRKKIDDASMRHGMNLDESIIVLNETTPNVVEIGLSDVENDVVEVPSKSLIQKKSPNKKSQIGHSLIKNHHAKSSKKPSSISRKVKKTNKKHSAKTAKSSSINDENRDGQIMESKSNAPGECEDIEVVWVSDTNGDAASQQQTVNEQQPFVIDTEPTLENLTKTFSPRTKKVKRSEGKKKNIKTHKKNQSPSNIGSNDKPSCSDQTRKKKTSLQNKKLREIVIDGCNVAMGHKNGTAFSEKGLQIVIDYFKERGHVVTAFLPQSMRSKSRALLEKLHTNGNLVFTPSRKIGGKNITPYDDRFILEYATKCNGIVVSSDQFRDLWQEKPQWRDTIENRLLAPTFVGDYLMFPEDPLGRTGPKLEEFLRHK